MRKILAPLAVAALAAAALITTTATSQTQSVDPTVSYTLYVPATQQCATGATVTVTVHGVRDITNTGCTDPTKPLANWATQLTSMMANASQN